MDKTFKHQDLITKQNLTIACPDGQTKEIRRPAFRWSLSPIEHEHNFLPNFLYDKVRNAPQRINDKADENKTCRLCALSMFISEINAKKMFLGFNQNIREKLGYTHVAAGEIIESDGVSSEVDAHGHFGFFEYKDCNFFEKFVISCELI